MNISDCIVTDRLIIRPFVEGDEADVFNIMKDDYTAKWAGFKPMSEISEAQNFMHSWRHEAYALTERGSDTVIGIIQTPRYFDWKSGKYVTGLGYWLGAEYRGRGYMTEAVEAIKDYCFNHTYCDEMELFVYCGNEASRNLAIKCGFFPQWEKYKDITYSLYGDAESEEHFSITKEDFEWEQMGKSYFSTAC